MLSILYYLSSSYIIILFTICYSIYIVFYIFYNCFLLVIYIFCICFLYSRFSHKFLPWPNKLNQSINQSINRSVGRSVSQSVGRSIGRSVNLSLLLSVYAFFICVFYIYICYQVIINAKLCTLKTEKIVNFVNICPTA